MTYHLLYLPEGEPARYTPFATREEVVAWFKAVAPKDGQAYLFTGSRVLFTGGVFRYLVDGQDYVPLFDPPMPGPPVEDPSLESQAIKVDPGYEALTPHFPALNTKASDDEGTT